MPDRSELNVDCRLDGSRAAFNGNDWTGALIRIRA